MNRSDFVTRMRKEGWRAATNLQEAVMALVYDLGEAVNVDEINLHPNGPHFVVLFHYHGEEMHCSFTRELEGEIIGWAEIYVATLPDCIPDSFLDICPKYTGECDIHAEVRGNYLFLGLRFRGVNQKDVLKHVFETLVAAKRRIFPELMGQIRDLEIKGVKDNDRKTVIQNISRSVN